MICYAFVWYSIFADIYIEQIAGQILLPHYKTIFSGISASSLTTSARGVLSGKR